MNTRIGTVMLMFHSSTVPTKHSARLSTASAPSIASYSRDCKQVLPKNASRA